VKNDVKKKENYVSYFIILIFLLKKKEKRKKKVTGMPITGMVEHDSPPHLRLVVASFPTPLSLFSFFLFFFVFFVLIFYLRNINVFSLYYCYIFDRKHNGGINLQSVVNHIIRNRLCLIKFFLSPVCFLFYQNKNINQQLKK
jgi:hypothetical protein